VLDLFAGTGALGLESLSRGAAACLAVDNNKESLQLIRRNSAACFFTDKLTPIKRDLRKGLIFLQNFKPASGFSLVFLDPPYNKELSSKILKELADGALLATQATVIIEEDDEVEPPSGAGCLALHDKRTYGETGFWFYTRK
jgi:16S rRNA (guanine966-N2)-methyltransferase